MEVMISTFVATLMTGAVIRSVIVARNLSYSCTQQLTAFSLAKARFEELKSLDYGDLDAESGSWESDLDFVQLEGTEQKKINCYRYTLVNEYNSPERKQIRVIVWWYVNRRWRMEQVWGTVYPS